MKSTLFLLLLVLCLSQGSGQVTHREDKQSIVYRFNNLSIIISNHGSTDPLLGTSPLYRQFPFREQEITVYDYFVKLLFTETTDPFQPSYHPTRIVIDTSSSDAKLMRLEDLQVRLSWRNLSAKDWEDVSKLQQTDLPTSFPFSYGNIFRQGRFYMHWIHFTSPNNNSVITFRNKRSKKELLRFNITGVEQPRLPALGTWLQDTSRANTNLGLMHGIPYHGIVPSEKDLTLLELEDTGLELDNQMLPKPGLLALYFKGFGGDYRDSILEYRLDTDPADTGWHKTGNRLVLTKLQSNEHYKLQVRYVLHPAYIKEYTFYITPEWYQTTAFRLLLLLGVACIASASVLTVYRLRAKNARRRKEQLSLEVKAIRSQLNPHFVFNALSSIQGLVNKNDTAGANHYLTEFSKLLRESLAGSDNEMVPLNSEIQLLRTYLGLEQMRFHFQYTFTVDDALDTNATEVPSLLLQPLIENAVKHGVSGLHEKGVIQVSFTKKGNDLAVIVSDNGKGFTEDLRSKGMGLKLTRDRITLLNQAVKNQPVSLHITGGPGEGTTVHLLFKNWL